MKLRHGRVTLELHERTGGVGTPLLLLHELGGSAAGFPADLDWPGPVFALDFSGHGASGSLRGGGYSPELLVGDADAALARLETAALVGQGLGAYVALLLAGVRSSAVPAALLLPGAGLAGGGEGAGFPPPQRAASLPVEGVDPQVASLAGDVRPADYAAELASEARCLLFASDPEVSVAWWSAVRGLPQARAVGPDLASALTALRQAVGAANAAAPPPAG